MPTTPETDLEATEMRTDRDQQNEMGALLCCLRMCLRGDLVKIKDSDDEEP